MSTNTNIFDVNKKFVDLVGLDYFWGKAKNYIDTADANLASDLADLAKTVEDFMGSGEGSVVEQLAALDAAIRKDMATESAARVAAEEAISADLDALNTKLYGDGTDANKGDLANLDATLKAYADQAEADAKTYTDDELAAALGAYATTGEDGTVIPATGIRAEIEAKEKALSDAIAAVEADAKSYSVVAVTGDELAGLGANVKEAYKLVDEDSAKAGDYIKIYKDSALKSVVLNGQSLEFTYTLADGTDLMVPVDVSSFLAEAEFKDGLQVVDHVVSVKVDAASEGFLTVGADGVKLSGVQDAIDAAANGVSADLAALEAQLYGTTGENATEGDLAKMKAALEKYADDAVAVEAGDRKDADDALQAAIDALTKQLYGEDGSENVGDLATMKAELEAYADQAEADALAAANTYTDELFESVQFVTEADINGLSAGWAYPVAE